MDYSKAKIYNIYNNIDDEIYVGSTCSPLSVRMARHREGARRDKWSHLKLYAKMREIGIENFFIELLEEYPECENIEQLRRKEGKYIKELKPLLNQRIAGRTAKEHYNDTIEHIKKYKKEERINKKEILKERDRKNYEKKKDILCQKVKCSICDLELNKSSLNRHIKRIHSNDR